MNFICVYVLVVVYFFATTFLYMGVSGLVLDEVLTYREAAIRELHEETSLEVSTLYHVATLKWSEAECAVLACKTDISTARTMETEEVFQAPIQSVIEGLVWIPPGPSHGNDLIRTMYNLPWLVVMALQCMRGAKGFPISIEET
jgi:8-oxo-dGTP pyrophosphatase MutT (NUDIX family)